MQPMSASKRLIALPGKAPEDVVMDQAGMLVAGVDDGRVLRIHPLTGACTELVKTGGRPLGLEVLEDGRILICDSPNGLLEFDPATKKLTPLVTEFNARPIRFCSNAVAAQDGTIFFSTSTDRYTIHDWRKDIIEGVPTGCLYQRSPGGRVERLMDKLHFANGLALARDESWIVVAESSAYCLRRYWLKGSKAGTSEVFASLPGFPDNCSMSENGLVWVAIAAPRNPVADKVHRMPMWVRRAVARLPDAMAPKPERVAWAMAFNDAGRVVHNYCWTDGEYGMTTGVCQWGSTVFLSSLSDAGLMAFELPGE